MVILYHYGDKKYDSNRPNPPNTDHKPGGLWLSEDREDGWEKSVLRWINNSPYQWCHNDLKYMTMFEFTPSELHCRVKVIKCKDQLDEFVQSYRERIPRLCRPEDLIEIKKECAKLNCPGLCFNCFGFHIDWRRFKSEFDSIAITPYLEEQSHRHQVAKFHWYRFDCSSWCFWDTSHLSPIQENQLTGYECDGSCSSVYCSVRQNRT